MSEPTLDERIRRLEDIEALSKGTWPIAFTWCATGYIGACVVAADLGIRDQPWWKSRPGDYLARNGKRFMKRADEGAVHAQATWFGERGWQVFS